MGKTAFFLYPNLEYACASGELLALDTKETWPGTTGPLPPDAHGYQVAVIDLRSPTRSDGYNLLTLINTTWMSVVRMKEPGRPRQGGEVRRDPCKTIVNPERTPLTRAERIFMTRQKACSPPLSFCWQSTCRPRKDPQGRRHIVSVFKLVGSAGQQDQEKSFHILMDKLPDTHKADGLPARP
ncbi:MAG: hypothetical protein ACLUES_16105 [Flavonifractor plautii]